MFSSPNHGELIKMGKNIKYVKGVEKTQLLQQILKWQENIKA